MKTYPQDELVTVHRLGHTFKASRRTVQHLDWTIRRLKIRWPHATLIIIQVCFNTNVALSKGTHDFDAVFDFRIAGLPWWLGQRFLRYAGWGAWWRHTGAWATEGLWHFHAISLPPGLGDYGLGVTAQAVGLAFKKIGLKVGEYIDGGLTSLGRTVASSQVMDYCHRTFGLAGQHTNDADHSQFPRHIGRTVFKYDPTKDVAA